MITTKLPGRHHGYEETLASFEESRRALGVEQVDLYLIHWPNPSVGKFVDAYRAMVRLREDGLIRSIGVSNFTEEFLERVADATGVMPAVNQVELHPHFPQEALRAFHAEHGIRTESWAPLGRARDLSRMAPVVAAARRHGVTEAQIVLRWHTALGSIPIPKSADPARQAANLDIFGFELAPEEVEAITALGEPNGRLWGADPNHHEEI